MKKQLSMIGMLLLSGISFAQTDRLWSEGSKKTGSEIFENKSSINNPKIYSLDINGLKNILAKAPKRLAVGEKSEIIISFPNSEGTMENFKVRENSNFDPQLAAKYPDIKSMLVKVSEIQILRCISVFHHLVYHQWKFMATNLQFSLSLTQKIFQRM